MESNPVCRKMLICPCCMGIKGEGLVMCWSCWHAGKHNAELAAYQDKAVAAAEAALAYPPHGGAV